jgi:hypothetical protein
MDPRLYGWVGLGGRCVGWILVGGTLLIAAFAYVMVKLIVFLAKLILLVGASALRVFARIVD